MSQVIGATRERTRNRVILETGQETNVLCGADILLSGLYQNLKGTTSCPICEKEIEVIVKNELVFSIIPPTALLHYVVENPSILSICCAPTFIFDQEECLNSWLHSYTGSPGKVSSLRDFMIEAVASRGPRLD
jgi:hypothetical protein